MDDQSPLNPFLGSIFSTQPTAQQPTAEGGQMTAPLLPGAGGSGLMPKVEDIQVPDIKTDQKLQEVSPGQKQSDICPGCHRPDCGQYEMAREDGMPAGQNPDYWFRLPTFERAGIRAAAKSGKQLYVCPGCGGNHAMYADGTEISPGSGSL